MIKIKKISNNKKISILLSFFISLSVILGIVTFPIVLKRRTARDLSINSELMKDIFHIKPNAYKKLINKIKRSDIFIEDFTKKTTTSDYIIEKVMVENYDNLLVTYKNVKTKIMTTILISMQYQKQKYREYKKILEKSEDLKVKLNKKNLFYSEIQQNNFVIVKNENELINYELVNFEPKPNEEEPESFIIKIKKSISQLVDKTYEITISKDFFTKKQILDVNLFYKTLESSYQINSENISQSKIPKIMETINKTPLRNKVNVLNKYLTKSIDYSHNLLIDISILTRIDDLLKFQIKAKIKDVVFDPNGQIEMDFYGQEITIFGFKMMSKPQVLNKKAEVLALNEQAQALSAQDFEYDNLAFDKEKTASDYSDKAKVSLIAVALKGARFNALAIEVGATDITITYKLIKDDNTSDEQTITINGFITRAKVVTTSTLNDEANKLKKKNFHFNKKPLDFEKTASNHINFEQISGFELSEGTTLVVSKGASSKDKLTITYKLKNGSVTSDEQTITINGFKENLPIVKAITKEMNKEAKDLTWDNFYYDGKSFDLKKLASHYNDINKISGLKLSKDTTLTATKVEADGDKLKITYKLENGSEDSDEKEFVLSGFINFENLEELNITNIKDKLTLKADIKRMASLIKKEDFDISPLNKKISLNIESIEDVNDNSGNFIVKVKASQTINGDTKTSIKTYSISFNSGYLLQERGITASKWTPSLSRAFTIPFYYDYDYEPLRVFELSELSDLSKSNAYWKHDVSDINSKKDIAFILTPKRGLEFVEKLYLDFFDGMTYPYSKANDKNFYEIIITNWDGSTETIPMIDVNWKLFENQKKWTNEISLNKVVKEIWILFKKMPEWYLSMLEVKFLNKSTTLEQDNLRSNFHLKKTSLNTKINNLNSIYSDNDILSDDATFAITKVEREGSELKITYTKDLKSKIYMLNIFKEVNKINKDLEILEKASEFEIELKSDSLLYSNIKKEDINLVNVLKDNPINYKIVNVKPNEKGETLIATINRERNGVSNSYSKTISIGFIKKSEEELVKSIYDHSKNLALVKKSVSISHFAFSIENAKNKLIEINKFVNDKFPNSLVTNFNIDFVEKSRTSTSITYTLKIKQGESILDNDIVVDNSFIGIDFTISGFNLASENQVKADQIINNIKKAFSAIDTKNTLLANEISIETIEQLNALVKSKIALNTDVKYTIKNILANKDNGSLTLTIIVEVGSKGNLKTSSKKITINGFKNLQTIIDTSSKQVFDIKPELVNKKVAREFNKNDFDPIKENEVVHSVKTVRVVDSSKLELTIEVTHALSSTVKGKEYTITINTNFLSETNLETLDKEPDFEVKIKKLIKVKPDSKSLLDDISIDDLLIDYEFQAATANQGKIQISNPLEIESRDANKNSFVVSFNFEQIINKDDDNLKYSTKKYTITLFANYMILQSSDDSSKWIASSNIGHYIGWLGEYKPNDVFKEGNYYWYQEKEGNVEEIVFALTSKENSLKRINKLKITFHNQKITDKNFYKLRLTLEDGSKKEIINNDQNWENKDNTNIISLENDKVSKIEIVIDNDKVKESIGIKKIKLIEIEKFTPPSS